MIKETMDKKFGASWHAVVGEGYGFEITHEVKNLLYMFFGGNVAIVVWKCSWVYIILLSEEMKKIMLGIIL